ncbi:protein STRICTOSIDINE SYNTHASE-LIKE 5-like, partial [Macadamia integrifolia]|uniref:protein STRICTOSIDINE SYNTHASE-LIKE 5-like n=1 Tax=Macadamia integrifolia TaxID=60698 RepID=UPI001C4F20C4
MAISKTTLAIAPVAVAALLYRLVEFDPAPMPEEALSRSPNVPANRYGVLGSAERIGEGLLPSNEDLAYDADTGLLYTGCSDGWIKRFHVEDSAEKVKVENWAYTGGRPLGLAFGPDKQLTVADADKGLLRLISNGEGGATPKVELLTDEAEGLKFRLTDSQDVGRDGVIYFTDASYKYSYADHLYDLLEGRPYGRLLSFDPSTNETKVLVRDLYFANGVTLSPDQEFLIFCETMLQRCNKYHLQGKKKGIVENFIDNLPGMPDNIRYDGDGHYWIALAAVIHLSSCDTLFQLLLHLSSSF